MVQLLQPILQNLGFQVSNDPTSIHEHSQPTIDIIKPNRLSTWVKYISVPISYFHDKYGLLTIDNVKLKTTIQTTDISTKRSTNATTPTFAAPTNTPPPTSIITIDLH